MHSRSDTSIFYLGTPYSDPDPRVRAFRQQAVTQMAFDLLKQNKLTYSPITHNMPIDALGIFGDYKAWLEFDHAMLSRCNELLVLQLPGWEQSKGLKAEMDYAKSIGLPITFIEPSPEFLNTVASMCSDTNTASPFNELLEKIYFLIKERDWEKFHTPKNVAMSLHIESAEVAEHFVWLTPEQSQQLNTTQKEAVAEELGDVFFNLLVLSRELGIDLIAATRDKIEKIKQKYPVNT